MIRIITLFILLMGLSPTISHATHIVGGEMNYRCLGNDQYEIELTVFRDCFNGNPNAFFDDPARIGIYNSTGTLIDSLFIPFDQMLNDTLDPVLSDPCLVVPPNVCVHTTTYVDTVSLLVIPGGYQLIYQRCCRNFSIANIVTPLDTGATFGVNIGEDALNECNNSAVFNEWPPIYICVNEPINFDQSATDLDGDSIVYSLCTPLDGATPGTPLPEPFQQTIPQEVVWVEPPYNLDNVLGGVPLAIDPNTGILTGTPNTIGQFVVGICLEEYRDGQLISTTRRDFQYNVGICGQALSSFFAPEIICEGLTVTFQNQSENADNFEWYFNDPAFPDSIALSASPTQTFSDTGTYNIVLIAEPNSVCVDTFEASINLQLPSLFAEFDFAYANCTDSLTINVADLSFDTISDVVAWDWVLSNGQGILDSSNLQNPVFVVNTTTVAMLDLIITAANGCTQELTQSFPANVFNEETFPDELTVCNGTSVPLNPDPFPGATYSWAPSTGLNNPGSQTPIATPDSSITYVVFIDNQGQCELYDTINVLVDTIMAGFTAEVPCDFEVVFTNQSSDNATGFTWLFNDAGNPGATSILENPNFVYSDTGNFVAQLIADVGPYCMDTAFQFFFIDEPVIIPDFEFEVDNCTDSFTINVMDQTQHLDNLSFEWDWYLSQNNMLIDSFEIQNPTMSVFASNDYELELFITDVNGCTNSIIQSFDAQVFSTGMIPDVELLCPGDSVQLNPNPTEGVIYSWSPATNISDPNVASPMIFPAGNSTYVVMIEDQYGCTFTDEVMVTVSDFDPLLEGYVEMDTIFQGDTTQLFTTVNQGYIYSWDFSESLSDLMISNPLVYPIEDTTYDLEITDENGCTNTIQLQVFVVSRICDVPYIFLPNAFTPNGDGENDGLRLMGSIVEEMHLIIYNRWGEKVFETRDQSTAWDGTFKGSALPPDVYGFYLSVRCVNQEDYTEKGNITLLR